MILGTGTIHYMPSSGLSLKECCSASIAYTPALVQWIHIALDFLGQGNLAYNLASKPYGSSMISYLAI